MIGECKPARPKIAPLRGAAQQDGDRRPLATDAVEGDRAPPTVDEAAADGEPEPTTARPGGKVRLEDAGQDVGRDPFSIVAHDDAYAAVVDDREVDVAGAGETRVLGDVDQDVAQLAAAGHRQYRGVGPADGEARALLPHLLELGDAAHDRRDVGGLG